MTILIDKRIQKFVEGCIYEDNGKIFSIHLKDIDETFWFNSELEAQEFLNKQAIERVGDSELRTGTFEYMDTDKLLHRYLITVNKKGQIISYLEEIVNEFTDKQLYEEYGYLMNQEHGKDIELLVDIMRCNGFNVEHKSGKYIVIDM